MPMFSQLYSFGLPAFCLKMLHREHEAPSLIEGLSNFDLRVKIFTEYCNYIQYFGKVKAVACASRKSRILASLRSAGGALGNWFLHFHYVILPTACIQCFISLSSQNRSRNAGVDRYA